METAVQDRVDFTGDVLAWGISQTNLTPGEERGLAEAENKTLLGKIKSAAPPEPVSVLFRKLIAALPPHQNPAEFAWTLATIESREVNAFTCGGGFVYVFQPLLESLLADGKRGEGALALVLAHEVGHVVLGHCRRGFQRERIERELEKDIDLKVDKVLLGKALKTTVNVAGELVRFTYSREQEYEADLFALHLCRNAGLDPDHVLDGLRWLVMLQHPKVASDPAYVPKDGADEGAVSYLMKSHPSMLRRLRRLRMELSGTFPDEASLGLFAWEPGKGALTKAKDREIGEGERSLVLVHGMAGNEATFLRFRELLGREPPARVLEFRYPNNGSLAQSAAFLKREIDRAVRSPDRAVFVAHSAGGLVLRTYAEKLKGPFARVLFLGTPHRGSNLVSAKFLLDLVTFAPGLRLGLPEAVDQAIREGDGQIGHDLHPDSLLLRWLADGPPASLAAAYRPHAGQLGFRTEVALKALVPAARAAARKIVDERLKRPVWLRDAVLARIESLQLGPEMTEGDGVVSIASATAVGKDAKTWDRQHHLSLTGIDEVVKEAQELLK